MRKLTKPEVEGAPHWAKAYFIQVQSNKPIFYAFLDSGTAPMPNEEFDITGHKFSDSDIGSVSLEGKPNNDEYLHFVFDRETDELIIERKDAIAMAKALKLTADDLR